jgi:SAM-dependent methyltransferase
MSDLNSRKLKLTEAEVQLLIVLVELSRPKETPNNNHYRFYPKTIEEAATYFRGYREDWTEAYISLNTGGWVEKTGEGYHLTPDGIHLAEQVRSERPPIFYWYKEYYTRAPRSQAYAEFCERLYGKNLCQANFSDMEQLEKLIELAQFRPNSRALDLGCGTGMIAEYLSDRTDASILGVDYCAEALQQAQERTRDKRTRLNFCVANLDSLDFPDHSFDTIISIDTLYMPNNLLAILRKLCVLLKPGGQMVVFYSQMIEVANSDRSTLLPENTPLGAALRTLGLDFQTWDFSEEIYYHLQHKRRIGEELHLNFLAEGHLALFNYLVAESETSTEPYLPDQCGMRRYLYQVKF